MPILGHGIDLVEVARIARMLDDHSDRFLERCFTAREQADSGVGGGTTRRTAEHLAARFAAKEAAMKALGTGLADGLAWTDFEVIKLPSGQPTLNVTGQAAAAAARLGITRWTISLTHTGAHAAASVIAES